MKEWPSTADTSRLGHIYKFLDPYIGRRSTPVNASDSEEVCSYAQHSVIINVKITGSIYPALWTLTIAMSIFPLIREFLFYLFFFPFTRFLRLPPHRGMCYPDFIYYNLHFFGSRLQDGFYCSRGAMRRGRLVAFRRAASRRPWFKIDHARAVNSHGGTSKFIGSTQALV